MDTHCSWPDAALAAVIEDGSASAAPRVGGATRAHVEFVPVLWVGVHAVRFPVTETGSWSVGGGGGGGGWTSCGASARFGGGGRWKWGQLWMLEGGDWRLLTEQNMNI